MMMQDLGDGRGRQRFALVRLLVVVMVKVMHVV